MFNYLHVLKRRSPWGRGRGRRIDIYSGGQRNNPSRDVINPESASRLPYEEMGEEEEPRSESGKPTSSARCEQRSG